MLNLYTAYRVVALSQYVLVRLEFSFQTTEIVALLVYILCSHLTQTLKLTLSSS